jgi:hypothetical protein
MKGLMQWWLALVLASVCIAGEATPTTVVGKSAYEYSSDVARDWFQLNLELAQQTPGSTPPSVSRSLAYLAITLYETVVPGMPKHRTMAGQLSELSSLPWAQPNEELHWPTAANAAMALMTTMLYPNASPENKARIKALELSMPLKRPQDFDESKITTDMRNRSQTFGQLMAMALFTWARTDEGHDGWGPRKRFRDSYVPPSGPGLWSATPPGFQKALQPWWGNTRPFVATNADVCAPPAPPEYSEDPSSAFYQDAKRMYEIAVNPTPEQRQIALYWADEAGKTPTPAGHWVSITNDLLREDRASLARAAEVFAKLNIAVGESFIVGWRAKFKYNVLRPVTFVQMTMNSKWTPRVLPTPPFPSYPSGHSHQSMAAALVLQHFFGEKRSFTDNTHNDRGWGPRQFPTFMNAAIEAGASRIYAGIHYDFDVKGGQEIGKCVADQVLKLQTER